MLLELPLRQDGETKVFTASPTANFTSDVRLLSACWTKTDELTQRRNREK